MSLYFTRQTVKFNQQLTLKDSCVRMAVKRGEVQEKMINTRDLQVLGVSAALWK